MLATRLVERRMVALVPVVDLEELPMAKRRSKKRKPPVKERKKVKMMRTIKMRMRRKMLLLLLGVRTMRTTTKTAKERTRLRIWMPSLLVPWAASNVALMRKKAQVLTRMMQLLLHGKQLQPLQPLLPLAVGARLAVVLAVGQPFQSPLFLQQQQQQHVAPSVVGVAMVAMSLSKMMPLQLLLPL